jgi:hypothetical protein
MHHAIVVMWSWFMRSFESWQHPIYCIQIRIMNDWISTSFIISKLHAAWSVWINLNVWPSVRLFDTLTFYISTFPGNMSSVVLTLSVKAFPPLKSSFYKDWRFPCNVSPIRIAGCRCGTRTGPACAARSSALGPPGRVLGQSHPACH